MENFGTHEQQEYDPEIEHFWNDWLFLADRLRRLDENPDPSSRECETMEEYYGAMLSEIAGLSGMRKMFKNGPLFIDERPPEDFKGAQERHPEYMELVNRANNLLGELYALISSSFVRLNSNEVKYIELLDDIDSEVKVIFNQLIEIMIEVQRIIYNRENAPFFEYRQERESL